MVDQDERRVAGPGERRRYNRRQPPSVTPPYFETFDRIASALEAIADVLVQLAPDVVKQPRRRAPTPRASQETAPGDG